ncbi:bacteriocin immunity protein [Pseudomonas sp. SDI]|uniref:bacteriocin immunity protein n=1 Tax=Pseudomonas sp. SDI TaxID=2170734 RepID=UPI000DE77B6F|nr:bacteriocin immunity protein [Pseudomonas sp. SDI]PWB31733.1 bacteriocin immunity protein [Pseudomonas sp. SDI]
MVFQGLSLSSDRTNTFSNFTEAEFVCFVTEIFTANRSGVSDKVLGAMLDRFCALTEHPDGTDLIYWPASEELCTPEGITQTVKAWRRSNGLPGFKSQL